MWSRANLPRVLFPVTIAELAAMQDERHPDGIRLGDSLRYADTYFLRLFCGGCGRVYEIGIPQAIERLGPDISTLSMRRRLRCQCGRRGLGSQLGVDYGSADWRTRRGPAPEIAAPRPDAVDVVP